MISGVRNGGKMPCESCAVQFSVFKRKRVCCECERYFCSGCLRRGGGAMCAACRVLSTRPLSRSTIAHLKVRDLQCFLQRQNVSTRGCVEKDELLSLCVSHVNSAAYRRRGSRNGGAFSTLKGFTNNINEFINSAFDLRPPGPQPTPAPAPPSRGCCNSTHTHAAPSENGMQSQLQHERFSVTPGGERDVRQGCGGEVHGGGGLSRAPSGDSARVDTADCFEIEDLDDAGWEFVTRPADPLPTDSEVLLSATEGNAAPAAQPAPRSEPPPLRPRPAVSREHSSPGLSPALVQRAASELELRSAAAAGGEEAGGAGAGGSDSTSLQDEPLADTADSAARRVTLGALRDAAELERLSVRQLKELLARNRVEFRSCIERAELLARARRLYRDHEHYRDVLDSLPIEECCKICMAAPLECVLLECGHIAACTACARQLAECPICRQYVVRAVRFFRS